MKEDIKKILAKVQPAIIFVRRYFVVIFVFIVICVYGFMVFQIKNYNLKEPTEEDVNAQLQVIKNPKVDQAAVDKILQLKDQNIQVQALFQQARNNPFQD